MTKAILGKKVGMTRIFDGGREIPVTVIEAGPCKVLQVKTKDKEGYEALQIGFDSRMNEAQFDRVKTWYQKHRKDKSVQRKNWKNVTQAELGHLLKTDSAPKHVVREVPYPDGEAREAGDELTVELFEGVEKVDVTGTSKGRGFSGTIRRHGFGRGPASHGSKNVRMPGSIGMSADPSRVIKGKRMAGQYGNAKTTVRNLELVRADKELGVLLVKGSVPGPNGGYVMVRQSLEG